LADKPKDYVYIVGPTGEPLKVAPEDYAKGGYEGSEVISRPVAERYQKEADQYHYMDETMSPVEQVGFNAVNTLGMNLPGMLGIKLAETFGGQGDADRARALVDQSAKTPYGIAGSGLGFLGGLAAGGESLLGKTPMGLTGSLGGAAERIAARVLPETPGLLGTAAKPILSLAARGGAEGAMYGLAAQANHDVIRDVPLTVDSLAAGMGEGALYGGLVMGGLGALGKAAGAATDALGGAVLNRVGGSGARAEARIADRLGLTETQMARGVAREGDLKGILTRAHRGLEEEGLNFSSRTSEIASGSKKAAERYQAVREGIVQQLDKEAVGALPYRTRIVNRAETEISKFIKEKYEGTPFYRPAVKAMDKMLDDLRSFNPFLEQNTAKGTTTWESLMKTRDILADKYDTIISKAGPDVSRVFGNRDVYQKMVGIFDSEMTAAMKDAAVRYPGLSGVAEQYTSATAMKTTMGEVAQTAAKKAVHEVVGGSSMGATIQPWDASTLAMGALTGHAAGGLGIVAARMAARKAENIITPHLAEMAFKSMTSAKAAAQTELVKGKIREAVGSFFRAGSKGVARATTAGALALGKRDKAPSREQFEDELERTRHLISAAHAQQVQKFAMDSGAIHPEMPQAIMAQYQRAKDYVQFNIPAGKKAKQVNSLEKQPKVRGLNLDEYKFLKQIKGIRNPLSVLDDLNNGSLSREQVLAMKAAYPELHAQIVTETAYKIAEMKEQGKYMPADKVAKLAIMLDSPIDNTLQPDFIAAVQASFPAPPPPGQPPPDSAPPPVQGLMTPIDKTLA
jgi:hypothetical protein